MSEDVYIASTSNVKYLKKQRKRIEKLFNRAIRERNEEDLVTLTKIYALLYSAYAETSFLKLIHTPGAFNEEEIEQIMNSHNLEEKWCKCVECAFRQYKTINNKGQIANKKKKLDKVLRKYIIKPSEIRNKVAHGQWEICLNTDCTKKNDAATSEMQQLDFVKIDKYYVIYDMFQQCILDLIVSPRTHYRDFNHILSDLKQYISRTENWTLDTKKQKILTSKKYVGYQNRNNQ